MTQVTRDQIFAVLKSNMEQIIEGAKDHEINPEKSLLKDYGADSLQVVEVVSRTMKRLGVKIPRTKLSKAENIGQLLNLFEEAAKEGVKP